jgi:hypothetical protein
VSDVIEDLIDAHVEYQLTRLERDALPALIDEHVAALFQWFGDVKFNDAVAREQIVGVIDRYAIHLKVSGGITELAGEMANVIFSSEWSAATRVKDVLDPEIYEDFAEKLVSLDGTQRELVRYVTRSPAFAAITAQVISRIVVDLLFRHKLLPDLQRRVGTAVSRYVERSAERLTPSIEKHLLEVLDPVSVREFVDEIWDSVADRPLPKALESFTAQDLEDFVVLVYEFWLRFRKTAYFRAVSTAVVDRLFAKYGDESLSAIIDDMGISEDMVKSELKTFFVPLFEHARGTGFLEKRIRATLEPFYRSPAAKEILMR